MGDGGFWMLAPEVTRRSIAITGCRCGFRIGQGPSGRTGGARPLGGQLRAAAMMLDEVDQKGTENVDLCVVEAPPQLVLHLSALREGSLTDAFPRRAQVQPLLAAVARQVRALQVVQ